MSCELPSAKPSAKSSINSVVGFRISDKTHHRTALPAGTDRATAVEVLHDHDAMMHFGPHIQDATPLPEDSEYPGAKAYRVTDIMEMLPKSIWSSNVVSTYYYTDEPEGVHMTIKAPLSVLMETKWTIQEQDGQLFLDEDVLITCTRFLMGTVKGQCDGNYRGIHDKYIEKLKQVVAEQYTASKS
jgi:hypothetical protein